jgi:DNA-directed RNA polymerase subunit omega
MDVISLPIEMEDSKVDSRYRLVVVASERVRQLMEGGAPLVESRHTKPVTIALQEILAGKLEILHGKEAVQAQQEAKRSREALKKRVPLPSEPGPANMEQALKKEMNAYLEASAKQGEPSER